MKKKMIQFIRKYAKWMILFVCIVVFTEITIDVFGKEIMKKDIIGYQMISNYLISDFATPIAKVITTLGGANVIIFITLMFLLFSKNKKIGVSVLVNLMIVVGLNTILKNIVQRPRPTEYRIINETGYSFPSGHSMVSMAFYGYIIYLIFKLVKNKKIKIPLIIALSLLIFTIGISRIYLGVHYTSDVLAGFAISLSYLIIYTSVIKKFLLERDEENE